MKKRRGTKLECGTVRNWADVWRPFVQRHAGWWKRVCEHGAVYAVPRAITNILSSTTAPTEGARRGGRSWLTPEEGAAEGAFYDVCSRFDTRCIGVRDELPLIYPLPLLDDDLWSNLANLDAQYDQLAADTPCREAGTSAASEAQSTRPRPESPAVRAQFRRLDSLERQQLGYVGALLCAPEYNWYRQELEALRRRSVELADELYARLPHEAVSPPVRRDALEQAICYLRGPFYVSDEHSLRMRLSAVDWTQPERVFAEVERFSRDLVQVLRKTQLSALLNWDLPLPLGVLEGLPLAVLSGLLGGAATADHHPSYMRAERVRSVSLQSARGRRDPVGPAEESKRRSARSVSPRGGHPSSYESAFRCWFIECTLKQRYPRRRGLVARLEPVLRALLGVQADRVRQIRKMYTRLASKTPFPEIRSPSAHQVTRVPL